MLKVMLVAPLAMMMAAAAPANAGVFVPVFAETRSHLVVADIASAHRVGTNMRVWTHIIYWSTTAEAPRHDYASVLKELSCGERSIRDLQFQIFSRDTSPAADEVATASEWAFISPDSRNDLLRRMICEGSESLLGSAVEGFIPQLIIEYRAGLYPTADW